MDGRPIDAGGGHPGETGGGRGEATPSTLRAPAPIAGRTGTRGISPVSVEVVIPVFNGEKVLAGSVDVLCAHLDRWLPFAWKITIVDNASTDRTREIAEEITSGRHRVDLLALDRKGKGLALRSAWSRSDADIVAYTDVDLSTGLDALLPMVGSLAGGHSDVAIGSRLSPGARCVRGPKRELVSRCYNALLRGVHGVRFRDAQCGFKAVRADVIGPLLAHIDDDTWFFDTELLLLAEYNGLRVHEVPVDWVEDSDSRVNLARAAAVNLLGVVRVALAKARGRARIPGLPTRFAHPAAASGDRGRLRRGLLFGAFGVLPALDALLIRTVLRTWWPTSAAAFVGALAAARLGAAADWLFGWPARPRYLRGLLAFWSSFAPLYAVLLLPDAPAWGTGRLIGFAELLAASAAGMASRVALIARHGGRAARTMPQTAAPHRTLGLGPAIPTHDAEPWT